MLALKLIHFIARGPRYILLTTPVLPYECITATENPSWTKQKYLSPVASSVQGQVNVFIMTTTHQPQKNRWQTKYIPWYASIFLLFWAFYIQIDITRRLHWTINAAKIIYCCKIFFICNLLLHWWGIFIYSRHPICCWFHENWAHNSLWYLLNYLTDVERHYPIVLFSAIPCKLSVSSGINPTPLDSSNQLVNQWQPATLEIRHWWEMIS